MKDTVIKDAIANIASTSQALDKLCQNPKNYNAYGISLLEQMSWELQKQAVDLEEFSYYYGL